MPAFSLRSHSPDDAATDCGDNIKLQLCSVYIENFLTNQTSRGLLSVAHSVYNDPKYAYFSCHFYFVNVRVKQLRQKQQGTPTTGSKLSNRRRRYAEQYQNKT